MHPTREVESIRYVLHTSCFPVIACRDVTCLHSVNCMLLIKVGSVHVTLGVAVLLVRYAATLM